MSKDLTKYDFILAIDKSGSMANPGAHNMSRWKEAQETTLAIATKAAEFDDDGITVIPFARTVKIYDSVTPAKVSQVFAENEPSGGTDTAGVLKVVFDRYTTAKAPKPVILIVITDGEPDDREAVKTVIRNFAATLNGNGAGDTDDFGILFLQIGNDASAMAFLKELDNNLNAKFDIVATKTADELEGMTLTEAFIHALEG